MQTEGRTAPQGDRDAPGRLLGGATADNERTWAILTHISAFAALVTGGIGAVAGPLVLWLIGRERYPSIDAHGKAAVNFNITIVIAWVALALVWAVFALVLFLGAFMVDPYGLAFLPFVVFAFFMLGLVIVTVFWLVQVIMATVTTSNGEPFRYALSFRFIK